MNKLCPLGPAGVGRIVNLFFGPACFPSCNYTKGALTHHPEGAVVFPAETVRSPRGMRLLRKPMDNATALGRCCHRPRSYRKHNRRCDCVLGYKQYPNLRQLPAKICHRQFYRRYGRLYAAHFLFAKKKQKPRAKGR